MKSIKNHFLILLALTLWGQAFCQEIYIPYRVGTKWGLCNEEGKIILEPKYDSLDFSGYDTNQDVLTPKINNKEGLIIGGKVLFEPVFEHIYSSNNLYFTTYYYFFLCLV